MTNAMNFVTFNQDYSCLAVGTHNGYRIYNCDPFRNVYENKEGDVSIIEMLFSTSLVALIFSPRRLVITNTKVRSEVHSAWSLRLPFLPANSYYVELLLANFSNSDRQRFASLHFLPLY
jgi:hypothetical protein